MGVRRYEGEPQGGMTMEEGGLQGERRICPSGGKGMIGRDGKQEGRKRQEERDVGGEESKEQRAKEMEYGNQEVWERIACRVKHGGWRVKHDGLNRENDQWAYE